MEKHTPLMLGISGLLIIILLLGGYYKLEIARKNNIIARVDADKSCDLQKNACRLELPNGASVSLDIHPKPIPLVQNFTVNVMLQTIEADSVSIDFKGTTMNMGPNNITLKKSNLGLFSGTGMLPVCIRNSMEWQADVYIQTSEGIVVAPFIFVTSNL